MLNSPPDPQLQAPLEEACPPDDSAIINGRCVIYDVAGTRIVMVNGVPFYCYSMADRVAEHMFIAQAQRTGIAVGRELAEAFGCDLRTVQRIKNRYVEGGAEGVVRKKSPGRPRSLGEAEEVAVRKWHAQGLSGREMARRLKVAPVTVGNTLRRLGLPTNPDRRGAEQVALLQEASESAHPDVSAPVAAETAPVIEEELAGSQPKNHETLADENAPVTDADGPEPALATRPEPETSPAAARPSGATGDETLATAQEASVAPDSASRPPPSGRSPRGTLDTDPADRVIDRLLASQGKLLDAVPFFNPGQNLPRLGVLLAVPMLVATGVLSEADKLYGHIGPAFYGLRTSLMCLVLMALLRIKRAENLKEYSPPELGRLLGLDRAPEVKTLRRKLHRLARGPSETLLLRLAELRASTHGEALGFLYVDGHVRVYNGKARLPKTHVTRMRISMPAVQDVWVNDAEGGPLLFVTQEAHPSLVESLSNILVDVREVVGDKRRITVVFDRGGWSPDLFAELEGRDFDVLTYRKGKVKPISKDLFTPYEVPGSDGKKHWMLHEETVYVGKKKLEMRQVTRLKGDHQTHIVTTRKPETLAITQVAWRMFNRWRQENFFKYMLGEYAIDGLVEYDVEADDPLRELPNPAWNRLDKALNKAKAKVKKLEAAYGAAAIDNPEAKRPSMRGFKIAHGGEIGIPLRKARREAEKIKAKRDALPKRLTVADLEIPPERLPARKQRLATGLKMLAYQVETNLVQAIVSHYHRADDEGRTLIQAALQSSGDLEIRGDELVVTLAPQSSPHRTEVIGQLCDRLNATATMFPGSALRLRYAIHGRNCGT